MMPLYIRFVHTTIEPRPVHPPQQCGQGGAVVHIFDSLERNNDVLKRILNHYDSVVPVMKRNADRVEEVNKEQESLDWLL